MTRRYAKGKKPGVGKEPRSLRLSWDLTSLVSWVLNLPRSMRILIVSLFSLAVILAVSPRVDGLYLQFFFTESTVWLPSFVSVGIGIIIYILGWRLVVGTRSETPSVRLAVFWYLVVGILAVLLVVGLLLQGYSIVNTPDL